MKARDVMRTPVISIAEDATLRDVIHGFVDNHIDCLPVVNAHGRVAGPLARLKDWNRIAIDASGLDHTPVAPGETRTFGEQLGPGRASRAMAIVHIAIFDSVNAIFGGAEIRVPDTWRVEFRGQTLFGGYSDTTRQTVSGDPNASSVRKTLIITGTTLFGGVEVKN